jgi:hypothetical protein
VETQMLAWIHANPFTFLIGYYVFMAAVSKMPDPKEVNKWWYTWLNGILHALAANVDKVQLAASKTPPPKDA